MLHELKPQHPRKYKKPRVGQGGKRGFSSGRGQKGQKSRSGHRIRPAERDLIIRIPKLRGYNNKPFSAKAQVVRVGMLSRIESGNVTLESLLKASLVRNLNTPVKILDGGELKVAVTVKGVAVSSGARKKIENAGGKIIANR